MSDEAVLPSPEVSTPCVVEDGSVAELLASMTVAGLVPVNGPELEPSTTSETVEASSSTTVAISDCVGSVDWVALASRLICEPLEVGTTDVSLGMLDVGARASDPVEGVIVSIPFD